MTLFAFLKFVAVIGLLTAGVVFLANGLGVSIPLVTYEGIEAYQVPVGLALLGGGIALAKFWQVSTSASEETTTTTTENFPDKHSTTTTTTKKSSTAKKFMR